MRVGAGFPAHAGMDPCARARPGRSVRLPRTRGDGPLDAHVPPLARRASPHTRGWTVLGRRRRRRGSGFPAHAGMDPSVARPDRRAVGLPRTRGDGPQGDGGIRDGDGASPHTRGWTQHVPVRHVRPDGFPAHAGMDPAGGPGAAAGRRLPRTRGDGPQLRSRTCAGIRASPHTRGWTRPGLARPRRTVGFPAHAGMDPPAAAGRPTPPGLPRTRGDGPHQRRRWGMPPGASPHTRGWTRLHRLAAGESPGFPAHAGMDPAPVRRRRR